MKQLGQRCRGVDVGTVFVRFCRARPRLGACICRVHACVGCICMGCMCVRVCALCGCMYVCKHVHVCGCVHVWGVCMCIVWVRVHVCVQACMCGSMYVRVCACGCMCVGCMCLFVHFKESAWHLHVHLDGLSRHCHPGACFVLAFPSWLLHFAVNPGAVICDPKDCSAAAGGLAWLPALLSLGSLWPGAGLSEMSGTTSCFPPVITLLAVAWIPSRLEGLWDTACVPLEPGDPC